MSEGRNPHYRHFLGELFSEDRPRPAVRTAPLTVLGAYGYPGGVLEHVVAIATLAAEVCRLHPRLEPDLLLAAVLVHELDVAG